MHSENLHLPNNTYPSHSSLLLFLTLKTYFSGRESTNIEFANKLRNLQIHSIKEISIPFVNPLFLEKGHVRTMAHIMQYY